MYEQDQWASKATDAMAAKRSVDEPGFEGFAARILAGFAESCRVIALIDGEDPPKFTTAEAPSMILATEGTKPFSRIELPRGYTARSIVCVRLDIVPASNDYKVVVAGCFAFASRTGLR